MSSTKRPLGSQPSEASCPGRVALLSYRAGDLSGDEARRFQNHVSGCARCRGVLQRVEHDVAAYEREASHHRQALLRALASEPEPARRRRPYAHPLASAVAVAALVVAIGLSVRPPLGAFDGPSKPPASGPPEHSTATGALDALAHAEQTLETRYKGAVSSKVTVVRAGHAFALAPDMRVRPQDILRFWVQTSGPGYLAVFSIDARGELSYHYPDAPPERMPTPMALARGGAHMLEGGIVLDDAPGVECWVVAFSPGPFDRAKLARQVRAAPWFADRSPPLTTRIGDVWLQARFLRKAG